MRFGLVQISAFLVISATNIQVCTAQGPNGYPPVETKPNPGGQLPTPEPKAPPPPKATPPAGGTADQATGTKALPPRPLFNSLVFTLSTYRNTVMPTAQRPASPREDQLTTWGRVVPDGQGGQSFRVFFSPQLGFNP